MKIIHLIVGVGLFLTAGATSAGSLERLYFEQTGEVKMQSNEFKKNDRVALIENKCRYKRKDGSGYDCRDVKVGQGVVLEVVDAETATIKTRNEGGFSKKIKVVLEN